MLSYEFQMTIFFDFVHEVLSPFIARKAGVMLAELGQLKRAMPAAGCDPNVLGRRLAA